MLLGEPPWLQVRGARNWKEKQGHMVEIEQERR